MIGARESPIRLDWLPEAGTPTWGCEQGLAEPSPEPRFSPRQEGWVGLSLERFAPVCATKVEGSVATVNNAAAYNGPSHPEREKQSLWYSIFSSFCRSAPLWVV